MGRDLMEPCQSFYIFSSVSQTQILIKLKIKDNLIAVYHIYDWDNNYELSNIFSYFVIIDLDLENAHIHFYSHIKINNKNYLLLDLVYEAPESKHKKQTNPKGQFTALGLQ